MIVLMMERLGLSGLGEIGFITGKLNRTVAYKFPKLFDESTGDLIKEVMAAVNEKLNEWNQKNNPALNEPVNPDFDIFISYSSNHKDQVRKLYTLLKQTRQFKCWLNEMKLKSDSLIDYVAKGIKNSKVFICCITKEYCFTSNCVNEINHAKNLNKPMVILMLERLEIGILKF